MAKAVKEAGLSEVALRAYWDLGYHIEEDVWSSYARDRFIFAGEHHYDFKAGVFAPLMQPHRGHSFYSEALQHPKIVAIAEQLCGGKVSGLQSTWYYGAPGTPGFNKHQDNWFVEAKSDVFVSAWSPMQDVTSEMGGVVGYPGTHLLPILPVVEVNRPGSASQDPNATQNEAFLPKNYFGIDLVVPMGAVLFMHSNFVHSTGMNQTDKFRQALLLTYIRQGESFRAGNTAKREEVNVYA